MRGADFVYLLSQPARSSVHQARLRCLQRQLLYLIDLELCYQRLSTWGRRDCRRCGFGFAWTERGTHHKSRTKWSLQEERIKVKIWEEKQNVGMSRKEKWRGIEKRRKVGEKIGYLPLIDTWSRTYRNKTVTGRPNSDDDVEQLKKQLEPTLIRVVSVQSSKV